MWEPPGAGEKAQVGALVVFGEGVSKKDIELALAELGKLPRFPIESCRVVEFDPAWGGPVWYIP
jgi:hypothetical protein